MQLLTEIVTMKTVEGITKEVFISIVDSLERDYHSKQPGFVDTELLYHEGNAEWIMVQHWDTPENQKAASRKMFQDAAASEFINSLNPKSVKMIILPQLGYWN